MDEKVPNSLLSGKAFQVFRVEVSKHLQAFEDFLAQGASDDLGTRKRYSASFHTIRGGSGFFGLEAVSTLSGTLEDLLGKAEFDGAKDWKVAKDTFAELKKECEQFLKSKA